MTFTNIYKEPAQMKKSVIIILFLVLLFHFPGYGAESGVPGKEGKMYCIGIVGVTHKDNPFSQLYNNLQMMQQFLPFEIVEGSSDMSPADSVRNLIGRDIDGLMLFVSDENVLPTICGLCEEAKMPWGIFLWQIQDEDIRSLCESSPWYIGNTGEREEETGAEMIRRAYDMGARRIALISEEMWNVTCIQREKGIMDALPDLQGMEIVATVRAVQDKQDAEKITADLIDAWPDLDSVLIVGTKGVMVPDGVIEGIKSRGKKEEISLFSIDLPVNLRECFDSGVLAAAYGLPALSLDPLFLFFDLFNYIEGYPLTDGHQSYYLHAVPVDNKERVEALSDFIQNPDYRFLTKEQILSLRKKENPSLDGERFQKFITDYIDSL